MEQNLVRGMLLVLVILHLFPLRLPRGIDRRHYDLRCRCCSRFSVLIFRTLRPTLLSIGAIDFGILVDGANYMVENIFRQIALRKGTQLNYIDNNKDPAA